MKTPVLMAAAAALSLWGCSHSASARADGSEPLNETEIARQARMGAPTVYNGEATGGAGFTVTTSDGTTWTPEVAPGNTVTRNASDDRRQANPNTGEDGQSEIIDEGPTPE